jgi:phage portal protein BeeE
MDFIEAKNAASRDIALAFGVPPMLLGIPGDNTYANYAEANRAFYRLTVLPLVNRTADAFAGWLGEGRVKAVARPRPPSRACRPNATRCGRGWSGQAS